MSRYNFKHGMSDTLTYEAWRKLKKTKGGVCLSWKKFANFLADLGPKPSPQHWLLRTVRGYQRSHRGNVQWRVYKKQFQPIWKYLTSDEIFACQDHIERICKCGSYDLDTGMNELYFQDLKDSPDPVSWIHSWIKRYLPKKLSVLKKQREKIQYNDEVGYES